MITLTTTPLVHRSLAHRSLARRSVSAALVLAAAGAGCTDDPGMPGDPDVEDPVDVTAPMISDTLPAANAGGVRADEKIEVTFSEPMDPATVEAAYSSVDLPLDQVALAWNSSQTVLSITPSSPLEYAEGLGTDPSVVIPKTYSITIGVGAADLAGNPLEAPLELTFATRRRLLASFAMEPTLTRVVRDTTLLSLANPIWIGDNAAGNTYRSYLNFDLSTLPAGSEIEAAEFSGLQTAPSGTPYALGEIVAQHVSYSTMANIGAVQALSLPGAFSTDATLMTKRLDVTAQVKDDVIHRAERGDRSQYRLQIDQATDGDGTTDTAVFTKDSFGLLAFYLVD